MFEDRHRKQKELPFPLCLCFISMPAAKLTGKDPAIGQPYEERRLGSARLHGRNASAAIRAGSERPQQHGDWSLL